MANVDLSVFRYAQLPERADIAGGFQKGMDAGKQLKDAREGMAMKDAYKNNTKLGPDGRPIVDRQGTLSALYNINPEKAMEAEKRFQTQDMEKMAHQTRMGKELMWGVKDQASWENALARGRELGIAGIDKEPLQYDPRYVDTLKYKFLNAEEQLGVQRHKEDLDMRERTLAESRAERRYTAGLAREDRNERRIETDMAKLSKDVAGTQDMVGALDEVEGLLGGSVDSFKVDGGKISKDGKSVDLPGASVPGLGRFSFYDTKARDLNSAAKRVFNATLKDRSGGAVTDNELERLRTEFNEGKFNTEPELINALKRYKRQAGQVLKNREAAYRPEVVERYTDQGGRTSRTMPVGGGAQEQSAAVPAPRQGTVEDGHVFFGGDPADPKNWKPVSSSAKGGR